MANVEVGQEAPDFTLKAETNQDVTLSALRGKPVVLFFHSLDFSPFCTTEACAYRDDTSLFEGKGAQIFGISRDSTWTHKAFKEKESLTYSLLADMKGVVAKLYACWNEAIGVAERLTVVIDADGKVTYRRTQRPRPDPGPEAGARRARIAAPAPRRPSSSRCSALQQRAVWGRTESYGA